MVNLYLVGFTSEVLKDIFCPLYNVDVLASYSDDNAKLLMFVRNVSCSMRAIWLRADTSRCVGNFVGWVVIWLYAVKSRYFFTHNSLYATNYLIVFLISRINLLFPCLFQSAIFVAKMKRNL